MTAIMLLPLISGSFEASSNGDWRETIRFLTEEGNPLDLSGISFRSDVREEAGSANRKLTLSTDNGFLIAGGADGTLSWAVPSLRMEQLGGTYVTDLVAEADGVVRNLCPRPLVLTVRRGVTR
ncbi:MAG: hypothetical protein ABTQ29_03330 [Siculibacillus sp.]